MAVSLKTDLRFPESGQHGHGSRIIQKDLKTQKMIIYLWTLISVVILWIFYLTNLVMVLVLFLVSMIALSAMAAATRPVLRAKLYQAYTRKKGD